jgi:hypothetical protein
VAEAFIAHPEEVSTRKEAIEILAPSRDVRAVPALLSALNFHVGNTDSERIALRAAQALRELHPNTPAAVQGLLGRHRPREQQQRQRPRASASR